MRVRGWAGLAALMLSLTGLVGSAAPVRAAGVEQSGGVTLDGWGGLHAFGGITLNIANAPYWLGWDIARALQVQPDGSGGWTLDGYGGIHAWGDAPVIATPAYWPGWDIARAFVLTSRDAQGRLDGRQGYLLDGFGGIHPWGGAPSLQPPYYHAIDAARGLEIHLNASGAPDGGWVLLLDGSVLNFGAAPPISHGSTGAVWQQLHGTADHVYAVPKWGVVQVITGAVSTNWSGYSDWGAWDIIRDIILVNPAANSQQQQPVSAEAGRAYAMGRQYHGGVALDGYGGVHGFGGLVLSNIDGQPYWPGWDIARAVQALPDGSGGWTLDGYGGIHAWGAAPAIGTPAYWPGWDIARSLVVLPDLQSGYLLDGWGGIHAFGPNAPALAPPAYWPGWDIARGLDIHLDAADVPDGGVVLDAWGGQHPFGNHPNAAVIAYRPGHLVYQQIHTQNGIPYAVERWGIVDPGAGLATEWTGFPDWAAWDITRDVRLVGVSATAQPQPISPYAAAESQANQGLASDIGYRPECGTSPSLRYAAAQVLVVSIACQSMTVYSGGTVWMNTWVTTGRPGYATPTGRMSIQWKRSPWSVLLNWPRGPAVQVAYSMQFANGGFLFHDAAWSHQYGPGSATSTNGSHGCIHVQRPDLDRLFAWTNIGATVLIT